jgi:hypothetical protein
MLYLYKIDGYNINELEEEEEQEEDDEKNIYHIEEENYNDCLYDTI